MKRLTALILCLIFALAGCAQNSDIKETPTDSSETAETTVPGFENYVGDGQLEIIRTLISANAYFVTDVFFAKRLPVDESAAFEKNGVKYAPVKSDKFKSYADLEESVYSIYPPEVARLVMTNPVVYADIDGAFCMNLDYKADLDYQYDWTDFGLEVSQASNDKCVLTVTVKDTSGTEKEISVTAILTDGNWKLENYYTGI